MKTKIQRTLLPIMLLGGLLFTAGCSTPTTSIGVTSKSDRSVLHVSSHASTQVQCVWFQSGACIEHSNTTPFRLILPSSAVHKVTLLKTTANSNDLVVKIHSPSAEPARFVMNRNDSSMELVYHSNRWNRGAF